MVDKRLDILEVDDEKLSQFIFDSILTDFKLLAMNIFTWEGCPDTIEPHIIEEMLFLHGMSGFVRTKEHGDLTLNIAPWTYNDINFKPTNATLVGMGYTLNRLVYWGKGTEKTRVLTDLEPLNNADNSCVIIKNNDLYASTLTILYPYLYGYFKAKMKLYVNLEQLSLNNIIVGDSDDKRNYETLIKRVRKNNPFNFLNVKKMKGKPENLELNIDFKAQELETLCKSLYGEALGKLGISAMEFEKRERMVTDEVNKNDEQIDTRLDAMLKTRQHACDLINELTGLNMSVKINEKALHLLEQGLETKGMALTNFNRNFSAGGKGNGTNDNI